MALVAGSWVMCRNLLLERGFDGMCDFRLRGWVKYSDGKRRETKLTIDMLICTTSYVLSR